MGFGELLAIMSVMAVPISIMALVAWMVVNISRNRANARGGADLIPRLEALEAQNKALRERIETLETIATTQSDWDARFQASARGQLHLPDLAPPAEAAPVPVAAHHKGTS
jgi:hypothetical protein